MSTGAYYPKSARPKNGVNGGNGYLRTTGSVGVQVGGGAPGLGAMRRQPHHRKASDLEPVYTLDKV